MALMSVFSDKYKMPVVRKGKKRMVRFRDIKTGDQCVSDMTGETVIAASNAKKGDPLMYRGRFFLDQNGHRRYPEEFGAPFAAWC